MDIELLNDDRALTPCVWRDVPRFCVITGANGVGKSQFLEVIRHGKSGRLVGEAFAPAEILHSAADWKVEAAQAKETDWATKHKAHLFQEWRQNRHAGQPAQYEKLFARLDRHFGQRKGQVKADEFSAVLTDGDLMTGEPGSLELASQNFARYRTNHINHKLGGAPKPEGNPPWEVLNDLVESAGLPFVGNAPELTRADVPFVLQFTHKYTERQVPVGAMSSGERVILKLFLMVFAHQAEGKVPRLLLLDEPDAHLHPAMVQRFIQTLQTVLVEKAGARVIMTTHSPTTVAVCNEDALFEMRARAPGVIDRFRKVTRDEAIGTLTVGVPSLRVGYQNRRQVFVESAADERIYTSLSVHLARCLEPGVSLAFIASGDAKRQDPTGCARVRELVQSLRQGGNETVFGLVDWDGNATPEGSTKVLAVGSRYSLENCVFDPIVLVAFLIKHKCFPVVDGLELPTFLALGDASDSTWQALVDAATSKIAEVAKPIERSRVPATSFDGPKVEVEQWLLTTRGHDLEDYILQAFPPLRKFGGGSAGETMFQIVDHVASEQPWLFPRELVKVLREIQGAVDN